GGDRLMQVDGLEHGSEGVIAVLVDAADAEGQIDLARGAHDHPAECRRHQAIVSAARAIARKASMSRVSPRADGSTPAARSTSSERLADPAQPASAARRVLRRCANAASTTANTAARSAS